MHDDHDVDAMEPPKRIALWDAHPVWFDPTCEEFKDSMQKRLSFSLCKRFQRDLDRRGCENRQRNEILEASLHQMSRADQGYASFTLLKKGAPTAATTTGFAEVTDQALCVETKCESSTYPSGDVDSGFDASSIPMTTLNSTTSSTLFYNTKGTSCLGQPPATTNSDVSSESAQKASRKDKLSDPPDHQTTVTSFVGLTTAPKRNSRNEALRLDESPSALTCKHYANTGARPKESKPSPFTVPTTTRFPEHLPTSGLTAPQQLTDKKRILHQEMTRPNPESDPLQLPHRASAKEYVPHDLQFFASPTSTSPQPKPRKSKASSVTESCTLYQSPDDDTAGCYESKAARSRSDSRDEPLQIPETKVMNTMPQSQEMEGSCGAKTGNESTGYDGAMQGTANKRQSGGHQDKRLILEGMETDGEHDKQINPPPANALSNSNEDAILQPENDAAVPKGDGSSNTNSLSAAELASGSSSAAASPMACITPQAKDYLTPVVGDDQSIHTEGAVASRGHNILRRTFPNNSYNKLDIACEVDEDTKSVDSELSNRDSSLAFRLTACSRLERIKKRAQQRT